MSSGTGLFQCFNGVLYTAEWPDGTRLTDICTDCDKHKDLENQNQELIVQAIEISRVRNTFSTMCEH